MTQMGPMIWTTKVVAVMTLMIRLPRAWPSGPYTEKRLDEAIFRRGAGEHEQLLDILRSIWEDRRQVFAANLPNLGAVPNLPAEAVLEMPAVAAATGLRPIQIRDFPTSLAAILARKLAATALTVEAALSGDRGLFVEALLADGAVVDRAVAQTMGDELLAAQRAYLRNP